MSSGHKVCFKHLKRNCKCHSPKSISLHHSVRVPMDGKKSAWKEFTDWLLETRKWHREELYKALEGTEMEKRIKK